MHTAFGGGDAVRVTVDALVVTRVPLHGDVELHAFFFVFFFVVGDLAEERFFRGVQMLDEVDDAALVLEGLFLFLARTLVDEVDGQAL